MGDCTYGGGEILQGPATSFGLVALVCGGVLICAAVLGTVAMCSERLLHVQSIALVVRCAGAVWAATATTAVIWG